MKPVKYFILFGSSGMLVNAIYRLVPEDYLHLLIIALGIGLLALIYWAKVKTIELNQPVVILSIVAVILGIIFGF